MAGNRNKRSCVDEGALEWYNPTIQYQRHAKGVHSLQCFKVPFAEMQMALFLFFGHFIIGIDSVPKRERCFCISGSSGYKKKGEQNHGEILL